MCIFRKEIDFFLILFVDSIILFICRFFFVNQFSNIDIPSRFPRKKLIEPAVASS